MTAPITLTEKNLNPDFDPKTDRIVRLLSGKLALMSFEFEPEPVYDTLLNREDVSNTDFWVYVEGRENIKAYITVSENNLFVGKLFFRDNNTLNVFETGSFSSWNEAEQALSGYALKTGLFNF